jgi:hypothetical protein
MKKPFIKFSMTRMLAILIVSSLWSLANAASTNALRTSPRRVATMAYTDDFTTVFTNPERS